VTQERDSLRLEVQSLRTEIHGYEVEVAILRSRSDEEALDLDFYKRYTAALVMRLTTIGEQTTRLARATAIEATEVNNTITSILESARTDARLQNPKLILGEEATATAPALAPPGPTLGD
jgi:hypothetical protein